ARRRRGADPRGVRGRALRRRARRVRPCDRRDGRSLHGRRRRRAVAAALQRFGGARPPSPERVRAVPRRARDARSARARRVAGRAGARVTPPPGYVLIRPETLVALQKAVEAALGARAADCLVAGGLAGGAKATASLDLPKDERVRRLLEAGREIGWGDFALERLTPTELIVSVGDSPFARVYGRAGAPGSSWWSTPGPSWSASAPCSPAARASTTSASPWTISTPRSGRCAPAGCASCRASRWRARTAGSRFSSPSRRPASSPSSASRAGRRDGLPHRRRRRRHVHRPAARAR